MALSDVIHQIDEEISKLQQARALLAGTEDVLPKVTRGRPKGSRKVKAAEAPAVSAATKAKRKLSPEGRKAIAEAMKRRWADRRKAASA